MIPCEYDDDDKVEYADDVNGDFVEYDEMAPLLPCVLLFALGANIIIASFCNNPTERCGIRRLCANKTARS